MGTDARRALVVTFVLALAGAIASYVAARATFGLLIGSVAFASMIVPPLALAVSQPSHRILIAVSATVANLIVWMFAIPVLDALECALVLFAFTFALIAVRSSVIAILAALVWLSLPILLRSEVGAWLVAYHPLLAMNGACKTLGIWTQQPILYRFTTLGQDVFYELPATIWPCVIAHCVIAVLLLIAAKIPARAGDELSDRQTRPTPPPAPQESRTP